jgi:hypothetical protein
MSTFVHHFIGFLVEDGIKEIHRLYREGEYLEAFILIGEITEWLKPEHIDDEMLKDIKKYTSIAKEYTRVARDPVHRAKLNAKIESAIKNGKAESLKRDFMKIVWTHKYLEQSTYLGMHYPGGERTSE